jgi:hypothetical protein
MQRLGEMPAIQKGDWDVQTFTGLISASIIKIVLRLSTQLTTKDMKPTVTPDQMKHIQRK